MPTAVTDTVTHAHIMFPAVHARVRQTVRSQHINLTNLATPSSCAMSHDMCNQLVFCPFLPLCPIFMTTWSSIKVKLPVTSAVDSTTSSLTVNNASVVCILSVCVCNIHCRIWKKEKRNKVTHSHPQRITLTHYITFKQRT